jgi:hypothetical protein
VLCYFCSGDEMSFATDFAVESDVEFDFVALSDVVAVNFRLSGRRMEVGERGPFCRFFRPRSCAVQQGSLVRGGRETAMHGRYAAGFILVLVV